MENKLKIIFIVSLFVLLYGCAYYNTFYNAKKYYQEAKTKYQQNSDQEGTQINNELRDSFDKVIRKSKKVLQRYPDSRWADDASLLIAMSNYYKRNYEIAREQFEDFIYNYPESDKIPEARKWYGKTLWELENHETAIGEWEKTADRIQDKEKLADLYMLMGESFQREDQISNALNSFKKVIELGKNKHRTEALFQVVNILLNQEKSDQAITYLNKLSQLTLLPEEEGRFQVLRAQTYRQEKNYTKAENLIEEKLNDGRVKNIWAELELQMGLVFRDRGKIEKAIARLQEVIENYEGEPVTKANYYLGELFLTQKNNFEKASDYYSNVNSNAGNNLSQQASNKNEILSTCIEIQNNLERKKDSLNLIESDTSEIDSISSLPDTSDQNIPDTSRKDSTKRLNSIDTLSLYDNYYNLKYELAEIFYFELGLKDTAKKIYQKLSQTYKYNPYVAKSLYALYYINREEGNQQKAQYFRKKLEEEYPNSSYLSYIREGKVPEDKVLIDARRLYQKAEKHLDQKVDSSLSIFKTILNKYPDTKFAPKSALSLGWIYENKLRSPDKALKWYQYFKNNFPDHKSIKYVNSRIDFLNEVQEEINNKSTEADDSSSISASQIDSTKKDSTEQQMKSDSSNTLDKTKTDTTKSNSDSTNLESPSPSSPVDSSRKDSSKIQR